MNAVVLTSSAASAFSGVFDSLCKSGRVSIYTSYADERPIPIDANSLHKNEIVISGSEGRTERDFHQSVRLLSFGLVDVKPLISRVVSYAEIEQGMEEAMSKDTYRVLLEHEA